MSAAGIPMDRPLLVRKAAPADLDRIVAIERASFTQPWSRAEFGALIAAPRVSFSVMTGGAGDVLGYAILYQAGEAADLANIAVAPDVRGMGLGRRLLSAVVEDARTSGVLELFLEVRESNRVARRLYESMGFSAVARRRRYYDHPVEDALVLRCDLRNGPPGVNRHRQGDA